MMNRFPWRNNDWSYALTGIRSKKFVKRGHVKEFYRTHGYHGWIAWDWAQCGLNFTVRFDEYRIIELQLLFLDFYWEWLKKDEDN